MYSWRHLMKATEVTTGLVESNGSLPPGGWLQVTCGLTAFTPGSTPHSQRSVTRMGELYLILRARHLLFCCFIVHTLQYSRRLSPTQFTPPDAMELNNRHRQCETGHKASIAACSLDSATSQDNFKTSCKYVLFVFLQV